MMKIEIVHEKLISVIIIVISVLLMGGIVYFTAFRPDPYADSEEMGEMPDLVGYNFEEAKTFYADKFEIRESGKENSDTFAEGAIIAQDIAAGTEYIIGSSVVGVTVSLGAKEGETTVTAAAETAAETTSAVTEKILKDKGEPIDDPYAGFEDYIPVNEVDLVTIGFSIDAFGSGTDSDIYNELYNILRSKGVDASYLYYDPQSGVSMEYNADERFSAGSIIKAVYARSILDGTVDLDAKYPMTEDMLNSPYELINGQPVGTEFTVRELIEAAVMQSDNTAYKMLYNYIGYDKFNAYAASLGLPQRMTDENYWFRLTARETAIYFKDIYNFISQHKNGELMEQCMTNAQYREMFASALPDKTVAEKYGYLPQEDYYTLGDSAIISGEDDYILVMYWRNTGENVDTEAFGEVAALTDKLHEFLKGNAAE